MSPLRPSRVLALVVALLMVTAACGSNDTPAVISSGNNPVTAPRDVLATAEAAELTSLVSAVEAAGLVDVLEGEGPITLFAPSDDAFAALPTGLLPLLLEPANSDLLIDILEHHIVEGHHLSADLLDSGRVTSIEGSPITVEIVEEPGATSDDAPATSVEVGGTAALDTPDQLATNGVVHVIDAVLVPEDRVADLEDLVESIPEVVDVFSTIQAESNLSTLVELIEQAGLESALTGEAPVTVFAPTNAAFSRLTAAQRAVLEDDPALLEAVLQFHIVPRRAATTDVLTQQFHTTLEGQGARLVSVDRGSSFTFGDAAITTPDIAATNGVVHVIDQVLIPDSARGPGGL